MRCPSEPSLRAGAFQDWLGSQGGSGVTASLHSGRKRSVIGSEEPRAEVPCRACRHYGRQLPGRARLAPGRRGAVPPRAWSSVHPEHTALASFTGAVYVAGLHDTQQLRLSGEGRAMGSGRDAGAAGASPAAELQPAAQLSAAQPFPRCLSPSPPGKAREPGVGRLKRAGRDKDSLIGQEIKRK